MEKSRLKLKPEKFLFIFFLAIINTGLFAQVADGYKVARWYKNKKAAVTYTFDDNTAKQLTVAVPLLDKYDFKATFYPVTNWGPNWDGFALAAQNGHEIGCHTSSHPDLSSLSVEEQEKQYVDSKTIIDKQITTSRCLTIAYPYCNIGDKATIEKHFIAGRICSGQIIPASPSDFYKLSSIACGSESSVVSADNFNTRVESAKNMNGWCVFLLHGIDNDGGYSPVAADQFDGHLSYVKSHDADYWVGSFVDVAKYIKERDAVSIVENLSNGDSIKVTVGDGLDNEIYNRPLTIMRQLPNGWNDASVWLADTQLETTDTVIEGVSYVAFEIVPDLGELIITRATPNVTSIELPNEDFPFRIWPNPFTDSMQIEVDTQYNYSIYNRWGQILENGILKNNSRIGSKLVAADCYVLVVEKGTQRWKRTIVKTTNH